MRVLTLPQCYFNFIFACTLLQIFPRTSLDFGIASRQDEFHLLVGDLIRRYAALAYCIAHADDTLTTTTLGDDFAWARCRWPASQ